MKFLVFQHVSVEHPGVFREFFAKDGISWDTVELDEGEPIPALDGYDALWVMGGPMNVWDEDSKSFLAAEKQAIRIWVGEGRPFMGLCLGHQLLADAMGGRVGPMAAPEIGIFDVELTADGISDPLFDGVAPKSTCLQWHGAAVLEAPPASSVLAHSPVCDIQALRVGNTAYGLQYHVEISAQTVTDWATVPEYDAALREALGPGAMDRLKAQTDVHLSEFRQTARTLYDNFIALVRNSAV